MFALVLYFFDFQSKALSIPLDELLAGQFQPNTTADSRKHSER